MTTDETYAHDVSDPQRAGLAGDAGDTPSSGIEPPRSPSSFRGRRWLLAAVLSVLLVGWLLLRDGSPEWSYETVTIDRGDVVSVVSASGRLRALATIKVGTEISGQVVAVPADFNATVSRGELLARIDPSRVVARIQQLDAQLASARATLSQARAAREKAVVDASIQARELDRRRMLRARGFASQSTLDGAESSYAAARSGLFGSAAQIESARAQIAQALGELASARLDLSRTRIVSPVDGVVINRLVEPGSTVAASFQTPNLFEIASDLSRMQVEVSVDEADIASVRQGQGAWFGVDGYPDRRFAARVRQIRKASVEVQNTVSYIAVLDVDNRDGALLPGMTANVSIVTGRRTNVVRVPAAALLFKPPTAEREAGAGAGETPGRRPSVWIRDSATEAPKRSSVALGLQGEDYVEVLGGVTPGQRVVTRARESKGSSRAREARDRP